MMQDRDLVGYGATPPRVRWPHDARIAISLVVNYEEGSENLLQDGIGRREMMGEGPSPVPPDRRDLANESFFEYGSRAGVWRLLRIFKKHGVRATFFACAVALERNPEVGPAITAEGHDILGHGRRWEEYYLMDREEERRAIREGYAAIERLTGQAPAGWYCRYGPSENTRDLVVEHGGFLYDSNSYADDLPYYATVETPTGPRPWLVVPYSLTVNDSKFWRLGLSTGEDFYQSMQETFDTLYEEGAETPKMMSVGLHCRIAGQPGRANGLDRFIAYAKSHPNVWFAGRAEIARTWLEQFPPAGGS
jgi:peptidoglycan/xylan/chitin deacetylase (PgdA/CDA1 family)